MTLKIGTGLMCLFGTFLGTQLSRRMNWNGAREVLCISSVALGLEAGFLAVLFVL